jgi:hypothetical protein
VSEHLRTDYDRMVGESYREYAARMRGRMLAAEHDRDQLAVEVRRLRAEFSDWSARDEEVVRMRVERDQLAAEVRAWETTVRTVVVEGGVAGRYAARLRERVRQQFAAKGGEG